MNVSAGMTFSTRPGKAYYYNTIRSFIIDDSESIVGQLVKHSFEVNKAQTDAWSSEISELQTRLQNCGMEGDIIFEYDIIRLGKRIDVILLIRHMVFSLEFKNGKNVFTAQDAQQAEDYAIDIKNFHKESENLYVCPILIATDADPVPNELKKYPDKQIHLQRVNIQGLVPKVSEVAKRFGDDEKIDFYRWFNSPYYPTPSIVEAAVEAYATKDLTDIARSEAGQTDIDACVNELTKIIEHARREKKKCLCFVTGVPGAGKTLVGLEIAAKNNNAGSDNYSVYLSGNGPLVEVLRKALIKSAGDRETGARKGEISAAVNSFIQGSFEFKKDNVVHHEQTPEHIMIFDEAQRVWDKSMMQRKSNIDMSEPEFLINVMDRHQDWAVIVCLVGLGQDIYDGETGVNEWFRVGIENFKNWELYYSGDIFNQIEDRNIDRSMIENCPRAYQRKALHLKTSIRSFRADKQCEFVDALLDNRPEDAKSILSTISDRYPVYITRSLKDAKKCVRSFVRGSQRCGLLASSSAMRLRPEGVYVEKDIDVASWFLAPSSDIRSSNMMEIAASEFKVQGLEVDWAVVCWDADLRRDKLGKEWEHYKFRGSKWMRRRKDEDVRYLLNSYRVLLTRARQGMVIFVPEGVDPEEDPTRDHAFYDGIYNYLCQCGIKKLDKVTLDNIVEANQ